MGLVAHRPGDRGHPFSGAHESGDNQDLISQVGSKTKSDAPGKKKSDGMSPKLGFCGILWVWRLLMLLMTSCTGSMLTI